MKRLISKFIAAWTVIIAMAVLLHPGTSRAALVEVDLFAPGDKLLTRERIYALGYQDR